jgi:hypothetical protein
MVLLEDHQTTGLARSGGAVAAAASNVAYWVGNRRALHLKLIASAWEPWKAEANYSVLYSSNEPVTEANTKYHCCDQVLYCTMTARATSIISFVIYSSISSDWGVDMMMNASTVASTDVEKETRDTRTLNNYHVMDNLSLIRNHTIAMKRKNEKKKKIIIIIEINPRGSNLT